MPQSYGAWRATYTPGRWVVLAGPSSLVVMQPAPVRMSALVNSIWDAVVESTSIDDLSARLAAFGMAKMKNFGAFFWDADGMHSLVRGSVRVIDPATGAELASGEGVVTWREVALETRLVRVDLEPVDQEQVLQLPLVVGAVTASAIQLDATGTTQAVFPAAREGAEAVDADDVPPAPFVPVVVPSAGEPVQAEGADPVATPSLSVVPDQQPEAADPSVEAPAEVDDDALDNSHLINDMASDPVPVAPAPSDDLSGVPAAGAAIGGEAVDADEPVAAPRRAEGFGADLEPHGPGVGAVSPTAQPEPAQPEPAQQAWSAPSASSQPSAAPYSQPSGPHGPVAGAGAFGAAAAGFGAPVPGMPGAPAGVPQPWTQPGGPQGGPQSGPHAGWAQPQPQFGAPQPGGPGQQPWGQPGQGFGGPQPGQPFGGPPPAGAPGAFGAPQPPQQAGPQGGPHAGWAQPQPPFGAPQPGGPGQQPWGQPGQGFGGPQPPQQPSPQPSHGSPQSAPRPEPMPSSAASAGSWSGPEAQQNWNRAVPAEADEHDGETIFMTGIAATHKPSQTQRPREDGLVLASMCAAGHANPPGSQRCRLCPAPVDANNPRLTNRPSLATLHSSSGESVDVVGPVFIGRAPSVTGHEPQAVTLKVPSPSSDISRTHVKVAPQEWNVVVTDLHSTNGTILRHEGEPPIRLNPGESVTIELGDVLDLGDGVTIEVGRPA